jgi:hypothetical protein
MKISAQTRKICLTAITLLVLSFGLALLIYAIIRSVTSEEEKEPAKVENTLPDCAYNIRKIGNHEYILLEGNSHINYNGICHSEDCPCKKRDSI